MYKTQCVLSLLLLYAGLAHSFDWDFVTRMYDRLQFYDTNGTLTHTQFIPPEEHIKILTYDPVHNRVLFADHHNIFSFDIASRTIETLVENTNSYDIKSLAYDPVSELLFWSEKYENMYSISLKPRFNNRVPEKQKILSEAVYDMAVDICGGFVYWISKGKHVEKMRINGSQRETVADAASTNFIKIDQYAQKIYWYDLHSDSTPFWRPILFVDLNSKNASKVHQEERSLRDYFGRVRMAFSKNHIYWRLCDNSIRNCSVWKIPKNAPSDVDVFVESNLLIKSDQYIWGIAAKYNIEDVARGVPNCYRLKSLLANYSDVSLFCVHGTKVNGEYICECAQGYIGERCVVSLCHNYCFKGDCTVNTEGEPKCRCNAGYSGTRCEVSPCQGYCQNDGVCSLNENTEPVCQCTAGYEGTRCEVNLCQGYCQNDGVCSLNENRKPVCQCTAGYGGGRCDVSMSLLEFIKKMNT